ncbi:MAG TPA: DUF2911 domain-containing protein [Cyclobacteriaceae bacterium]|nr:DUF2911 domain-containing protein [Cyclobacteriaceae bacterium]
MKNQSRTILAALLVAVLGSFQAVSQDDKASRPSPPAEATRKTANATITINYSQPAVKGREVWGKLVPYGQVWRAGANEATTFQVDKDVKVEGQALPAGKYGLFAIPNADEWTIIFNKVPNQWGAFKYDEKQDALRVKVKPKKSSAFNEKLVYKIENNGKVSLDWENLDVSFNVK